MSDVIIIGSGIGGLCCAALLGHYGFQVTVCESHTIPGGAAHGFQRDGYTFDSGPSLYSGMSYSPSANPLRQVLDVIGEDVPWVTYDTWGCWVPEGNFETAVGADQFCHVLRRLRGEAAVAEWRQLQQVMLPYGRAAIALPMAAIRFDLGAIATIGSYAATLFPHLFSIIQLNGSFSRLIDGVVTDPFVRNWLNLLCFMLSGLPAEGTNAAEMAFMFADWYRPQVVLDYPVGGSGALVDALVRGLQRHGGELRLNAHVTEIVVEHDRAVGVRLRHGEVIPASQAVIANASIWDTLPLLPPGSIPESWRTQRQAMPDCASFMHLHLGIDGTGLPDNLPCHHMVVNHWEVTAPQNVVAVSIPSLLDPSLAPLGHHVIHTYTPATEPYDLWQGLDRRSSEYAQLKQERAVVMWQALERIIPDIRDRTRLTLVGTPLTHQRFLRRYRGSYGPALAAGTATFPGPHTPLPGLLCCGDSTFPGIGLPAVAASGMIAANTVASVSQHLSLLRQIQPLS